MSIAAYLRSPPAPPNDPTWLLLDGTYGWRIAPASNGIEVSPSDCALILKPIVGSGRSLTETNGSFGGLVPPSHVTVDVDGAVWLLDRPHGALQRFDVCSCKFLTLPCTGGLGHGARQLVQPGGIAACGANLLVTDAGGGAGPSGHPASGRVLVFARRALALRALWRPPRGSTPAPWRPVAVACDARGRALVADPDNGAVHVFDRGGTWRAAWTGFGAVAAIAVDAWDRIYTLVPGETHIRISDANGEQIGTATEIDEVAHCFRRTAVASVPDGRISLELLCPGSGWFDVSGNPTSAAVVPGEAFASNGVWLSEALDSAIARCQWHRFVAEAELSLRTGIAIQTYTSEAEQPIDLVAALPNSAWTSQPALTDRAREVLILAPPGRYLWLKATLSGRGSQTPRLKRLRIEFPRITLRRYLPAAFAPDPVSADFTDRVLAIFDQGFRSVERKIDNEADYFDPRSAPATSPSPGAPDMLTWLASWIGVTFDRSWPVARRRRFLRAAARLFPCRGTPRGVRQALLLYLGLDQLNPARRPAFCAPRCAPPPSGWSAPPLILEHWKIRRWLFLGGSRLGDAALLWGQSIMQRSQLDVNAQLGVTTLDTTRAPELDPFNVDAYAFTAFVPGRFGRTARDRLALTRMLAAETPAYVNAVVRFVAPRMRIGIQASIGFDSVVGCWPEGIILGQAQLGRATVLSAGDPVDPGPRIGRTDRIGTTMRLG
jgi:phage tail-like protein